jgi:hypothetical protein
MKWEDADTGFVGSNGNKRAILNFTSILPQ